MKRVITDLIMQVDCYVVVIESCSLCARLRLAFEESLMTGETLSV